MDNLTFHTVFFPLSVQDSQNISRLGTNLEVREWKNTDWETLWDLKNRLDSFLKEHVSTKNPCFFLRLNSVSPKDTEGFQMIGKGLLTYELAKVENKHAKGPLRHLCVTTSEEILVTLCHSERVVSFLDHKISGNSIALREWLPDFPNHMEFRCFVRGGKIRAISQYFFEKYYPELQEKEGWIESKICEFFDSDIKELVSTLYPDAVMDVVIWPQLAHRSYKNLGVFIIEFNPFGGSLVTGAALFNWRADHEILYNSEKPIVRILNKSSIAYFALLSN